MMSAADTLCVRAIINEAPAVLEEDAARYLTDTPPPPFPPAGMRRSPRPPRLSPPSPPQDYEAGTGLGLRVQAKQLAEDAAFFAQLYAVRWPEWQAVCCTTNPPPHPLSVECCNDTCAGKGLLHRPASNCLL